MEGWLEKKAGLLGIESGALLCCALCRQVPAPSSKPPIQSPPSPPAFFFSAGRLEVVAGVGAKGTRELQMDKRRVHQVPSSEFETACSTQQTVLNKDNARAQGRYEPLSASSSCSFTYFFFLSYYGISLTGRIRYGSIYLKTESYYLEKLKKTICNFLYG